MICGRQERLKYREWLVAGASYEPIFNIGRMGQQCVVRKLAQRYGGTIGYLFPLTSKDGPIIEGYGGTGPASRN
jgi:hypothetical protein